MPLPRTGFSCSDASLVEGHFYPGLSSDPWLSTPTYSTDAGGVAVLDVDIADFTVQPGENRSVGGRTVVFHASDGGRAACGEIEMYSGDHAEMINVETYPDYAGGQVVRGMLLEQDSVSGVNITGVLTGLEVSADGGWHVHAGACDEESAMHTIGRTRPCSFSPLFCCAQVIPALPLRASLDTTCCRMAPTRGWCRSRRRTRRTRAGSRWLRTWWTS
jgi:hypothetical protein